MINKIKKVIESFTSIKKKDESIFSHKANGEPCCVCGKPMHTEQGITMVGSGEKMHSECWPDFFTKKIEELTNKANQ